MTFRPEDAIGYWLSYAHRSAFHSFAEALKASCQEHGKPYVVTPPQWGALAALDESDGLTAGMLSQRRRLDAPTVTGIITRLEQSGLVERRRDPTDRRVVKIYLTAEGREALVFLEETAARLNESVARGFSEGELEHFRATLQRFIRNIAAMRGDEGEDFGPLPDNIRNDLEKCQ
ncbi:MAG TPA: MarR family transcriptional regulator [Ktedonosporobacter sp.]|nr:MarR family transcriptional regulator [Ktedonosporobacter sp.]